MFRVIYIRVIYISSNLHTSEDKGHIIIIINVITQNLNKREKSKRRSNETAFTLPRCAVFLKHSIPLSTLYVFTATRYARFPCGLLIQLLSLAHKYVDTPTHAATQSVFSFLSIILHSLSSYFVIKRIRYLIYYNTRCCLRLLEFGGRICKKSKKHILCHQLFCKTYSFDQP